jgi:hypothetical protein
VQLSTRVPTQLRSALQRIVVHGRWGQPERQPGTVPLESMRGAFLRAQTETIMRTAARAFLTLVVSFWLLASPGPVAGAGGDQGDPRHRGGAGGDARHLHHGNGKQTGSSGPGDECLVEIHDESGALSDGATLCQTADKHICTFNLALCLNQPEEGCTPANFTKHTFRAMGHCGPVGLLRVNSAGTSSVCGAFTGVKVHTRSSGKAPGQCTIRAAVRSAKVEARTDVDTVTLVCMPPGVPCSITTTTTAPPVTSTTAPASTTTTSTLQVTTTTATTTTTSTSITTTTMAMSPSGAFLDALDWWHGGELSTLPSEQ